MNYGEEQKNELEALSEIYFNEIKIISDVQPISFSIKVRTQASNYDEAESGENNGDALGNKNGDDDYDSDEEYGDEDDDDDDDDNESTDTSQPQQSQEMSVDLKFDLPLKYPDEKPSIQVLNSQSITEGELAQLMENLSKKAEENLGTVMVFMLVSDAIEWLIARTEVEAEIIQQEKDKKQQEVEAEEKKRFEGTPVTESTFMAWKIKFDAEMLKANLEKQKQLEQSGVDTNARRLTGRAMFESDKTLAESDLDFVADLDTNQLEALMQNIEEDDEFVDDLEGEEVDFDDDEDDDEELDLDDEDESEEEEVEEVEQKSRQQASKQTIKSKR